MKDSRHAEAFWKSESLADEESLPLGERIALRRAQESSKDTVKLGQGGSREISFKPRSSAKFKEYEEDDDGPPSKRRGIQSLKLPHNQGRGRGGGRGRGSFRGKYRGRGRR